MKLKHIVMACLALAVGSVQAVELNQVIAGSSGYLAGFSNLIVGFYGRSGDEVVFGAFPAQGRPTLGFCGVARSQSPGELLATAYTNEQVSLMLSADDLHIFLCIRAAGLPGPMILFAASNEGGSPAQIQGVRDEFASMITLPPLPEPTGRRDQLDSQLRQLRDDVRAQGETELLEELRGAIEDVLSSLIR